MDSRTIDVEVVKRILLISLSNLGDAVLTLPCLALLKKEFPSAFVDVIVGPRASEVFQDLAEVHHLWVYDKQCSIAKKIKFIAQLRKKKYDLVVDLRHTLIPLFLNPKYRSSMIRKKSHVHAIQKHLLVLDHMGIKGDLEFVFARRKKDMCSSLFNAIGVDPPFVVLGPGAASPLKRWGKEKYVELADRIHDAFPCQILIVGARTDQKDLQGMFSESYMIDLVGKTTWSELEIILKEAVLFITNDSGPMHLAAALGTKTIGIFGPTDPIIYRPFGDGNRVIQRQIPCIACMDPDCKIKTKECLEDLSADEVYRILGSGLEI